MAHIQQFGLGEPTILKLCTLRMHVVGVNFKKKKFAIFWQDTENMHGQSQVPPLFQNFTH